MEKSPTHTKNQQEAESNKGRTSHQKSSKDILDWDWISNLKSPNKEKPKPHAFTSEL